MEAEGRSVVERIADAVDAAGASAPAVCEAVMARALAGTGPPGVVDWQDDRTVLVVAFTGGPGAPF